VLFEEFVPPGLDKRVVVTEKQLLAKFIFASAKSTAPIIKPELGRAL
jgi:hypothetical protein